MISIKSAAFKLHPDLARNAVLGATLSIGVYVAGRLARAGGLESGWPPIKLALIGVLGVLLVVLWWVIRIIAEDMTRCVRHDIRAAWPTLVALGFCTFYCLRESKDEILLLAGTFFVVLLVTQLSASSHDYLPERPALSLLVNLLVATLILIVSWLRFDLFPPFYLQVTILILILAAYEYVKQGCIGSAFWRKSANSSSRQPSSSFGQTTLIFITDLMARTFSMGVRVNLAVFWSFLAFYISAFHMHGAREELVGTMTTFYDLAIQIQAILLALVGAFAIMALQQITSPNRKQVLGRALRGFVGLNVFALIIYITGLLMTPGIDLDQIQRPLEIRTAWTASCVTALLLFEAAWLTIPPSLLYLYNLVLMFIEE